MTCDADDKRTCRVCHAVIGMTWLSTRMTHVWMSCQSRRDISCVLQDPIAQAQAAGVVSDPKDSTESHFFCGNVEDLCSIGIPKKPFSKLNGYVMSCRARHNNVRM